MQTVAFVCLLMPLMAHVSGHAIDQHRSGAELEDDREEMAAPRALKSESVLMGIANSLIGGAKTAGATGGQSLSLNMSNIVLMLVLRGLIWGVSYIQGGGKEARAEDASSSTAADVLNETDVMLFLGYLVADESGQHDCLNRVACEQPSRAESYLGSAETVWKTAKIFDGMISLDTKYEQMLLELQEAIDNGKKGDDCTARYKCFGSTTANHFNLI